MSTIHKPFANNTLTTYIYEPFSYTIDGSSTPTIIATVGIPSNYLSIVGNDVVFSTSSNGLVTGTSSFTLSNTSGNISSNTVIVNSGRFLDSNSNSFDGQIFTFYKNEPISPIQLVAPFAISVPTTVPTLPPGLTYTSNASNIYSITGTPLATVPQSNYLAIGNATGSNLGKIVTSKIGMSVSNERVLMNLSGSPIVSDMVVGTPIAQRILTTAYPPYSFQGTLRYTWSGLPDGINVLDNSGTLQYSPFPPSDPSSTLIIQGTPTINAANAYRNALISSNTVTFTATRTNPLPLLSNTTQITFAFDETVLFDTASVPPLYSGVALDPSATYFRAQTYFKNTSSAISNIFSPDLRSDLSINFVSSQGRGYLVDTTGNGPTYTGTASYTIRAINSNGVLRDLSVPITVTNDTITITGIDTCYNFILSRPLSSNLSGYYPSNIQFQATAASQKPVTFSTSSFTGTGISLSNVNSNTVQLVGIAEAITPLTTAIITASAIGTPATASTTFKYEILDDTFDFSIPTPAQLTFVQNKAITPIQLTVSTVSGRPVLSYTSVDLPTGLTITTTGLITGTPLGSTSGTFTVTASTGYTSKTQTYSYTIIPDTVLFIVDPPTVYYPPTQVYTKISGISYSGNFVSNFAFSGFSPNHGLSIDPSSGVISGSLIGGIPPEPTYTTVPQSYTITGNAGLLNATLPATFTATNIIVPRSFLLVDDVSASIVNYDYSFNYQLYVCDDASLNTWTSNAAGGTFLTSKNTSLDSNVYILTTGSNTYYRSSNGQNWTSYVVPETETNLPSGFYSTFYKTYYDSSAALWYAAGTTPISNVDWITPIALYTSSNDGVTWARRSILDVAPRVGDTAPNYFTSRGVAFGSNSGVILIGAGSNSGFPLTTLIQRSIDGGYTWSDPNSGTFASGQISDFELSGSNWIAIGSDTYRTSTVFPYFFMNANTIFVSSDQGDNWTVARGTGVFNVIATHITYDGTGTWLAAGFNIGSPNSNAVTALSYSTNPTSWSPITLPGVTFTQLTATSGLPMPEIGSIWTDDSNWYVLVKLYGGGNSCKIFQHSLTGDMTTDWTEKASAPSPFDGLAGKYIHGFLSNTVRTGSPTTITLGFDTAPAGGPVVTSPIQRDYLLYQYIPMTPVNFSATGTGTIYYFVDATTLPIGLTFDPTEGVLSGTPVNIGQTSFIIYVKDDVGLTLVTITINVVIPQVFRQQTSAGAWTSLIRQYTVVNAAQNSVNGRTLPATEPPLGEFMRPYPPDSVHEDPACKKC